MVSYEKFDRCRYKSRFFFKSGVEGTHNTYCPKVAIQVGQKQVTSRCRVRQIRQKKHVPKIWYKNRINFKDLQLSSFGLKNSNATILVKSV